MTTFYYEDFGCCTLCKLRIKSGAVVVAEITDSEPVQPAKYAHAQCWADSGRTVLTTDEMARRFAELTASK